MVFQLELENDPAGDREEADQIGRRTVLSRRSWSLTFDGLTTGVQRTRPALGRVVVRWNAAVRHLSCTPPRGSPAPTTNADVFIDVGPVDALTVTNQLEIGSLLC